MGGVCHIGTPCFPDWEVSSLSLGVQSEVGGSPAFSIFASSQICPVLLECSTSHTERLELEQKQKDS